MKDLALVAGIILLLFMAGSARNYKEDQVMTFEPELADDWICTEKSNRTTLHLRENGRAAINGTDWRWGINRLDKFCMAQLDECNTYPFECTAYDLEDGKLFLTPKSFPCTRFEKISTISSHKLPNS